MTANIQPANKWHLRVAPRRWQHEALERWRREMRGVVSVVTGGGKTVFAQLCILSFKEQFPVGQVLIVVPTISLLDQWYVSLIEDLSVSAVDIGCYSGEEKPPEPKPINILVINTARHAISKIAAEVDTFLIVDECHRTGSPINALALKVNGRATLGLTATPERPYDDGFREFIEPVLGPIIYSYDYVSAHRDGVIADFDLINVKVDLLKDEKNEYDKLTRSLAVKLRQRDKNPAVEEQVKIILQRRAAVSSGAKMRIPVAAKIIDANRGLRTILFHERVESANILYKVLKERNHSVTIYHSGISPFIRRDNLRLYRTGVYDVMVCCRALDEGINVPETTVAVIASSTASVRQRIQRLGRVLRPAPGKKGALIYTLYATEHEEKRLVLESSRLNSIASTSWNRSSIKTNG
jgi:superfamily II DNA or RNA helicase